MNTTELLYLKNTYLYAMLCKIKDIGKDEFGYYFITDKSIFYPQGGGQPNDLGYISLSREQEYKILSAKYSDIGLKHYVELEFENNCLDKEIAMHIFQDTRKLNASLHTAGHWLTQLVTENMNLPLIPTKGHHFFGESYIEFEGDINCITPDSIDEMKMAMRIDLQYSPKIIVEEVELNSPKLNNALLPKNFKPPVNKPLRLTTIEGYKSIPCGGTHVEKLRDIKQVTPLEFQQKGSKVRLKYNCEIWNMVAD